MGRSVDYPSNAEFTTFFLMEEANAPWPPEDGCGLEEVTDALMAALPSLDSEDRWAGNEQHVIASNNLGEFILCEYMGLLSLSFVAREWDERYAPERHTGGLAAHWAGQVKTKIDRALADAGFTLLSLQARFSNGEAMYTARTA